MKNKQKQMKNSSIHIIRDSNLNYEEYLNIFVENDTSLFIHWSISPNTSETLGHLLLEEFDHLHKRIVIYRINHQDYLEVPFIRMEGIQMISNLQPDRYYCEIVLRNSQNQAITIKRSTTQLLSLNADGSLSDCYIWKKKEFQQDHWMSDFSGYTVYNEKRKEGENKNSTKF